MSGKRQNNQLRLAFGGDGRSEAPMAPGGGSETLTAKRMSESPARNHEPLMEEVCAHDNCVQAYKRVKSNKGSPGIDGMTVEQLPEHLKEHWPAIREQLLAGTYKPQPVRRVEIPKPDGGVRQLGIPTVLDRMVQQAVMQVLQGRWRSYFGFCETPSVLERLDQWIRHRLRSMLWKQWKRGRVAKLRQRGVLGKLATNAAGSGHGPWRMGNSHAMSYAFPNTYFDQLGVPRMFPGP